MHGFDEGVDFGDLPAEVDLLLQQGVVAYRSDRAAAEELFQRALSSAPEQLPVYFCMYKILAYQGALDQAVFVAEAGLKEAARQAGWADDVAAWPRLSPTAVGPERFACYTLKALAFLHLKRADRERADRLLATLASLDPEGLVGWGVVADLAQGLG